MTSRATSLKQMPGAVRGKLAPRRHTALLVAIVAAFAVRPLIGDKRVASLVFSIAMLILVFVALYNIQIDELVGERERLIHQRRRWLAVGWVLGLLAVVERLAVFEMPSKSVVVAGSFCWLILMAFITWQELRATLRQKRVTGQTISMAISVYLLLGITWSLLYTVVFELQPEAFSSAGASTIAGAAGSSLPAVFPVLAYFSLATLSTIGYGDIVPVTLQARYLAVAEGITGQFYLAILVARLVAMQMTQSAPPSASTADDAAKAATSEANV
jgi:voltage-gated potassium channel